jgi:Ca-activated chloride channel family protein
MEPVVERVRLVLLPTTVTTRRGKIVRGLEANDFRLREEGQERTIDLFSTEDDLPVSLAFLVDVSASMGLRDRIGLAKAAISRIVDGLDPADRVALIRFADGAVEWESGFEDDRASFRRRLGALEAEGRTALYDALAATPRMVADEARGRKAIVLVTDGVDNASELPRLRATWMARGVAVPIYTVGFIPMREKLLAKRAREALRTVERFSTETGGALFPVHSEEDLDRASERIDEELRFQYLIGFYPEGEGQQDLFRDLELTTTRSGLRVRTRSGYYPGR